MASVVFSGVKSLIKGEQREEVAVATLDGEDRVLGLYFSAHWCPPCRGFTPKLAKWYTDVTAGPLKGKLEIAFVSSDKDESAFNEYFKEMPWLALPYGERDLKKKLSSKFKVSGIPTLVFVNAKTGELITKNGRNVVTSDPEGKAFPWREPTLKDILSSVSGFVNNKGETKTFDAMEGKPLAIYFSAHWCPPCRGFTPTLAKFYTDNAKDKFELIFVSGDRSEADFKEYLKEMPWYALPFSEKDVADKLNTYFEVEGIPHLVILDENLKVTTDSGRAMVERDTEAKEFPWRPKALDALHSGTSDYINQRPCLIYAKGPDTSVDDVNKAMLPTAEEYFAKNKDDDDSVVFLYTNGDKLDEKLLDFVKIEAPKLFLLDIPNGVKYVNEGPIDVADFLKKYEAKELAPKGLRD